jgi:hypothetical protein
MLGQINARGLVSQVTVQDSLLFVACGSWGAQIYSISDPANPRELGSMDAVINDLCVKDTFCYAVGGDALRVYNVASASDPRLVGSIQDSGDLVVVANGYAFSAGRSVMNIYNVTDPAHPTWANSRGGPCYALAVRRSLLFCSSVQPDDMTVLNISDPLNLTQVSQVAGYGGEGLYVDETYAYLSCTYEHHGLFVVDISDSSHPVMHDSIDPEGLQELEPYVPSSNSYGYLADHHGGLVTLDLHDPDSISEAWSGYKAHSAVDISIDGQRAYIANDLSGLQIVDVADPTNPVSLGIFDTVGTRQTFTTQARDSFAFIGWWGNNRRFLRVLNVTDPTSPMFAAEESCFNPPQDIILKDTFIYAAEPYEFEVFNVARPREPVRMGICESTDGNLFGLAVQDSFAYEASQYGMWIINVARPDSPFVVSSGIGLNAAGIAVRDTFVYLPYVYDTLLTYSVANPAQPRLLSSVKAGIWPSDIALGGSRGYVALNGAEGVETFDLTNPVLPVSRGQTSAPFAVREVRYSSGFVYAAMWDAGVAVYETTALGVQEQPTARHKPQGLHVYPDVTYGHVRFIAGTVTQATSIDVYDISGRRAVEARVLADTKGGVIEGEIDLSALAAGLYIVRVGSEGADFTAKVVKADRR